jgi:site-specific DNA recombinase
MNADSKGKRVGLWVRVSTDMQVEDESPEHHEARGRMYAEMKGWEVVKVYRLDAVSGKSVMGRPEAAEMLDDVRAGRITGLIFSKLARLARNTRELLEFADIFRAHDADLISLGESIDTSSPSGRFFFTLLAALSQWEREEISSRIAASVPIRAKLGKRVAGQAIYGYRWDEHARLVPDPQEAPVLKLMFELFREHRRIGQVIRLLAEAGYRNRRGQPFGESTVWRLLRNPVAKGMRLANYSRSDGVKRLTKPESEWVWVPVEAVVSEELWEECNRFLTERAAKLKRQGRPGVHLFSGVVACACGQKMYIPSNSPKYVCKSKGGCHNKISVADLERVFHEKLRDFFLDEEEVAAYLARTDDVLRERRELVEAMRAERVRLSGEMDKLYRLYQDDQISGKQFGERHRPLEERAEQLDAEIPRLQGEADYLAVEQASAAEIAVEAGTLYSRWTELSFEERREIVERAVEVIVVGREEVTIRLSYEPSPATSAPPAPQDQVLLKSPHNQTTAADWWTSPPTFPCARSGWLPAGTTPAAREGSSICPAREPGSSRGGGGSPSAAGASRPSIPRRTTTSLSTSARWSCSPRPMAGGRSSPAMSRRGPSATSSIAAPRTSGRTSSRSPTTAAAPPRPRTSWTPSRRGSP